MMSAAHWPMISAAHWPNDVSFSLANWHQLLIGLLMLCFLLIGLWYQLLIGLQYQLLIVQIMSASHWPMMSSATWPTDVSYSLAYDVNCSLAYWCQLLINQLISSIKDQGSENQFIGPSRFLILFSLDLPNGQACDIHLTTWTSSNLSLTLT